MKRTLFIFATMVAAILASVSTVAQTNDDSAIIDKIVQVMNQSLTNVNERSNGQITKAYANRDGRDIVVTVYLGSEFTGYESYNENEKKEESKKMANDFLSGLGGEVIDVFKSLGLKLTLHAYDNKNHMLSTTIDFKNL